jgi:hypothetical protein
MKTAQKIGEKVAEKEREPWSKFFWSDWRSDPGLKVSSFAAKGLWMDLLSIMHDADPHGYLMIAGRAPDFAQLAQLLGKPKREIQKLLNELDANGVYSMTPEGIIYSRRMVRDRRRREINRQNGKGGGNPALLDKAPDNQNPGMSDNRNPEDWDNPPDKPRARATRSQKPEAREDNTQPPSPDAATLRSADELRNRLEAKLNLATPVIRAPIVSWLQAGATIALIEATIDDVLARRPGWKPDGIGYFGKAVLRAIEAAKADVQPNGSAGGEITEIEAKRIVMKAKAEQIAKGQYMPTVEIDDIRGMIQMGWITAEQAKAVGYRL